MIYITYQTRSQTKNEGLASISALSCLRKDWVLWGIISP